MGLLVALAFSSSEVLGLFDARVLDRSAGPFRGIVPLFARFLGRSTGPFEELFVTLAFLNEMLGHSRSLL